MGVGVLAGDLTLLRKPWGAAAINAGREVLALAASQGWAGGKVRGWWWLLTHAGWVRERRRLLQAERTVPDRELARLLSRRTSDQVARSEVEAEPLRHAQRASQLTGATVLLKGATTVLVSPDGAVRTAADGPGWLATAGSGDVLAGLAGTLLAAGLDPMDAGATAVVVHGRAGRRASGGGPLSAEAVLRAVPAVLADLLT